MDSNFNYGISGFESEDKAVKVERILNTVFGKKVETSVARTVDKPFKWVIFLAISEDLVGDTLLILIEEQIKKLRKPVRVSPTITIIRRAV